MVTLKILVLAAACISTQAFSQESLSHKTTIFGDEKLEGGVFEHVDEFNDIALYSRSSNNPYRLPTTTYPEHYNLTWQIDISNLAFSGDVNIELYANQPDVDEIVIHAHDLNVTSVSLVQGTTEIPIQDYYFEPVYHFLRIRLLRTVLEYDPTNRIMYTLSVAFNAPLRTDMTGLYRNWFRNNVTDEVSWMASTHFQATAARFAFPCYDEPQLKATFNVVIRRPLSYSSWFCTRLEYTRDGDVAGYEEDVFLTTPRMPTYLLAIIVAEYESYPEYENGVLVYEVIGRPAAINASQYEYAFYTGRELLAEMSNHTNYDFYSQHPNLKMTQAAIPDFRAGAMENWGLLLYREAYIMYDENHTNGYFKQLIAYILSHEIAHMWFGNLVTCDWWDNFWLNEGFARYYQYFLTDWVEEHLGLGERFINEQVHSALLTDSANNPHPLTNPGIGDPVAIRAMFSVISYNKGAAVIRMTEHLLGSEVNREGLRNYLVDRRFGTAEPIHLFQSLQNAAIAAGAISEYGPEFDFIEYYRSWTEQAGHPVLNVQVDHQTGLMTINQRRFNINTGYSSATTNWIVPITFATASDPDFNNTKPTHIIKDAISIINRNSIGDEWVIFNKQQTGFYRVNYDDYTWDLIVRALRGPQRTAIHEYNRAQIVNDVFQFARSGIMSYNRAFNILSFLEYETEYTPWLAAITGFNWIRNRLVGTPQLAGLEALMVRWLNTAITTLGYTPVPGELFMTSYLRYQLAPIVCQLGVEACIESAVSQFTDLVLEDIEVPVDSRNWVYCAALRNGTLEDFEFLWDRFINHNVYTEKILLLQVLGCTSNEVALERFLDAIVQDNFVVRPQDYAAAFNSAVSGNEGNTQIVFRYIQENLQNVTNAFGLAETALDYVSARLRTIEEIEEFEEWADNNRQELGSSYAAVRAGAQTSRAAITWAANVQDDIQTYLTQGDQDIDTTSTTTVAPTPPSTVTPQPLIQGSTPILPEPDSANTAILSAATVLLALIANIAIRY